MLASKSKIVANPAEKDVAVVKALVRS